MPKTRPISLRFPVGGVARRHGYEYQPQHTTPDAKNVWPGERSTGRTRGGVRPGLKTLGAVGGAPYGWCRANWYNSGTYSGVAIVHAEGTSTSTDGVTWTTQIATNPASDFASCAMFNSVILQASGGGSLYAKDMSGGSAAVVTDAPTNCGIVIEAMDRVWVAGDTTNPHVVYASAVGDHEDWDYAATESSGAFASGGVNGFIFGRVTSLIHHGANCVIVGETDGMAVIAGNPRGGGIGRIVNQVHGPISQKAWCQDLVGNTWFFSRAGLYRIGAGCIQSGANIESVSRERLPGSLIGINPGDGDNVSLGYDERFRGVHIYVTRSGGDDEAWFFDVNDGGFWPMEFPEGIGLAALLQPIMSDEGSGLIAVTETGSAKHFNITQNTDYGTAIDSYLDIGPIKLGGDDSTGRMVDCFGVLAEDSGDAGWSVRVGESAPQAYAATPQFTGQNWTRSGLNYRQHPRVMGHSAYLQVYDVSGSRWSFEEIVCNVQAGGRRRVYGQ